MSKKSTRRQPTISLCVIAKNEEQFIADCVDSARAFVDEMVVVDTGSTDKTVELAKEHGARVEYFEWCDDFAAARNAAIEAATSDWILMLDADEELVAESGPVLRQYATQLPKDKLAYAVVIENQRRGGSPEETVRHTTTRFFPRRASIRYVGAIHEDLVDLADPRHIEVQTAVQIRVAHYGYDPLLYIERAKDARNMRLLQLAHEREPNNSRVLYYLGQQSYVAKRYAEAIPWFERFAASPDGAPMFWLVDTYQMWLETLLKLNQPENFDALAQRGEREGMLSAVSRETIARYELQRGHAGLALRHLVAALSPDVPSGMVTPEGAGSWRTRLMLADVHLVQNEPDLALGQLERAFAETLPIKRMGVAVQAAELAITARKQAESLSWIARAAGTAPDQLEIHTELLRLKLRALRGATSGVDESDPLGEMDSALAAQDWQTAYDAGMRVALGKADALARVVSLAGQLRERQSADAALDLLERVVGVYPPTAELYWPLIQVLTDLGRFDDALTATEILQKAA